MKTRQLRISAHDQGGGYYFGCSVTDVETGEPISCVQSVEIKMDMDDFPTAIITLKAPEINIIVHEQNAQIIAPPPDVATLTIWGSDPENDTAP